MIDPAAAQRLAADPRLSAFVTANAGSGKTKTLIDRVARLLLKKAPPEAILCVTYTKAAAAEMQRRLFDRLGRWSVMKDAELAAELEALEGPPETANDGDRLSDARALFAQALETPGGLKIQTIHAFCEKLLRRFPLEAGVSPGFRVIDDPAAAALADAARRGVARRALTGEGRIAEAYAELSVALDFQAFNQMFATFEAERGALAQTLADGLGAAVERVRALCRLSPGETAESLEAEALAAMDRAAWGACAGVLEAGGKTDQQCAAKLKAALEAGAPLAAGLSALFTQDGAGAPAAWVGKTSTLKAREDLRSFLLAEQDRLDTARERLRAARIAAETADALTLAAAYLETYRLEKERAGLLDFADLIERSAALLSDAPMAAWVLFKLDGGIDHILLDEAQDTAPEQWAILRALTAEFFVGEGRERRSSLARSLFVVGDEKQSIYSFQGAAPERLQAETRAYLAEIAGAGARAEPVPLLASFRSAPPVLAFVDAVFAAQETRVGVPPAGSDELVRHLATRDGHPGCVDLWPLFAEEPAEERQAWDAPLDAEPPGSANRRLAEAIACEIKATVARGDAVWEQGRWRAAQYGDFLILVRRRGALFEEILRALKHAGAPVAGADRLPLSEHILFADLLALARFCLFPADELNLAALLKSPLCGLEDDDLYALAHGRGQEGLWDVLQRRAPEREAWAAALAMLETARGIAGRAPPYELFARVLALKAPGGETLRARLMTRLGTEAEDALEEFLAQVQAAEQRGIYDLEGLAAAFARLDITVKRELEAGRNEVRVMTAHGAKGLEAPVVFLPETTLQGGARGTPLLRHPEGGFLWAPSKALDCEASAQARAWREARDEQEAQRLLYVGLTRARDRLVLCGRLPGNRKEEGLKGWWPLLRAAFAAEGIAPRVRTVACGDVAALRYGDDPGTTPRAVADAAPAPAVPDWARSDPEPDRSAAWAQPSAIEGRIVAAAASPLAQAGGLGRFRRGDLIHRLLQLLPDLPADRRADAAGALLAREVDLTGAQREEMAAAALAVLEDARFAEVFGPASRAEVPIAGRAAALPPGLSVSGRMDRLVVLEDRVLAVDFKTNRPAPDTIEAADPAYVAQMAVYWAVLGEIFPGRRIEAAIVWTDGPKLMPVPEFLLVQALADLRRSG